MSSQKSEKITCPGCGKEHDFEMWNSLNTMLDPDMKEKLLSKEMFQFILSELRLHGKCRLWIFISSDGRQDNDLLYPG